MEKTNYIPLGFQCTVPTVLQSRQLKGQTLPFDWMLSSPKFVYQMLQLLLADMPIEVLVREHFFNCTAKAEILLGSDGRAVLEHYITREDGNSLYNQQYDVIFPHDSYNEDTIQKYVRRFERLKQLMYGDEHVTYLYISPSSDESGEFWIDGTRVLMDPIEYLNKIYTLLQKSNLRNFSFKAHLTTSSGVDKLLPGIQYTAIQAKPVWLEIVGDCAANL